MAKTMLNHIDNEIIRVLYRFGIPMTLGEISKEAHISWITVKKHILRLEKLKIVERIEKSDRSKIIFNFEEFGNLAEVAA
jgi:DNA-binding MarR family transcriptional regulator